MEEKFARRIERGKDSAQISEARRIGAKCSQHSNTWS